jgi:hypothetical protein
MTDIALLAQQAMNALGPVLAAAATKAAGTLADRFLSTSGGKLFHLLTTKLTGAESAQVLDRAKNEPENQNSLDALQLEIKDLAEKDAEFCEQLAGLLKEIEEAKGGATVTQTSTQTGNNNKSGQATGTKISIEIR